MNHAIHVQVGTSGNAPVNALNGAITNYLENRSFVLRDQETEFSKVTPIDDTPEHFRAVWRFDKEAENQAELGKALQDRLDQVGVVSWYRIQYHECDHDEPASNRTGCSLVTVKESGSVPL